MSKQQITISDEIVKNVVRPVSLFLNDVPVGCVFTHRDMGANETHELDKEAKKYPSYAYNSAENGTIKFTNFDLMRFQNEKGLPFNSYFTDHGADKQAYLADTFKVIACVPYLNAEKQKVYAGMFHEGYESFMETKRKGEKLDPDFRMPQSAYAALYKTKVIKGQEGKYYRTVQIDRDIFYYEKEEDKIED